MLSEVQAREYDLRHRLATTTHKSYGKREKEGGGKGGGGGLTFASLGLAEGLGREASEVMEPDMSSTTIQCAGKRLGLSLAATVRQRSLPDEKHSRVTSWQAAKSAEKLMLILDEECL